GPVQFAFEVADQAGEARATEPASDHCCGKGRVVNTLTTLTPISLSRMLGDHEGLFYQLHLLNNFLLVSQRYQPMGRVHRAALQLIGNVVIDLRRRKSPVLMFRALWQNLWVKMAHPASPTGTAMEACCATMAHQRGQTMSFSLWPVTCKGIPVGRQVGTTCLGVFQCILGCKTGHSYHVGTVHQPTDSAMEAQKQRCPRGRD